MNNTSQRGFALLEGLLILLVITVLAAVGWYAVHTKHQTDKILSQADKISQNIPAASKKTDNVASNQKYLVIKEWGIKANYQSPYTLIYKIRDGGSESNGYYADVTSPELLAKDPKCSYESVGVISRLPGSFVVPPGPGTVEQAYNSNNSSFAHIDNYYYSTEHSHARCSDNADATLLQTNLFDVLSTMSAYFEKI